MRNRFPKALVALTAVTALALPGVAQARNGADDPAGHVRHGIEVRHHGKKHVRHHGKKYARHHARHRADDAVRHARGGADDGPNHR